ncbi:cryptochrome/photolyase family protein [Maribacter cobaltidurans]|uniref:Cryptochrome/photolyase family protein n=1 Tax=Maribacter cobaltidurans TaxID=1178778 RepID=A0A223V7X0_9FLAO|nr:cryptochrome/photolyase family protein [Maribacter cobaltidurans]ASV31230.1 cryptochrome/photolyase family protein [Maribacter cobaltidurans]GGD84005.1 cryptochrome/photolyase family protein [Maribacter cobaltidurans]
MKTLRLILGDQLNQKHSWFESVEDNVIYLMAEMRQETDYVKHHIQKVTAFFLAMRSFKEDLSDKGHRFIYLKIGDKNNPQYLTKIIKHYVKETKAEQFEYQLPDEFRLDEQLKQIAKSLKIETRAVDTEHFYTSRYELKNFFSGKKQLLMESFYRMMRKKHGIMVENGQPEGGKWNYDQSNRKKWKGEPKIPHERGFRKNVSKVVEEFREAGVETFGEIELENFNWPISRADCLSVLNYFCKELLIYFGDYQDAMHTQEKYLFHSRLSFAMNSKIVSPREVIDKVLQHYHENKEGIHISQVEGFIRQILGWREYMRGIYWKEMPNYAHINKLENHNKLPEFFWTGNTKMNCLKHAIGQSLSDAYSHHIQRLMIIGNFALLTQMDPDEVDRWYLGVYIDAIEWVEITNTRGMSQFADGGVVATKPYVSSANYINKMSDYCGSCHYKHNVKKGNDACPFNILYWNFLDTKKEYFKDNQRMNMMMSLLEKKETGEMEYIRKKSSEIINNLDEF